MKIESAKRGERDGLWVSLKEANALHMEASRNLQDGHCPKAMGGAFQSIALMVFPSKDVELLELWHRGLTTPGWLFQRQRLALVDALMVAAECQLEIGQAEKKVQLFESANELVEISGALLAVEQHEVKDALWSRLKALAAQIATAAVELIRELPWSSVAHLKEKKQGNSPGMDYSLLPLHWEDGSSRAEVQPDVWVRRPGNEIFQGQHGASQLLGRLSVGISRGLATDFDGHMDSDVLNTSRQLYFDDKRRIEAFFQGCHNYPRIVSNSTPLFQHRRLVGNGLKFVSGFTWGQNGREFWGSSVNGELFDSLNTGTSLTYAPADMSLSSWDRSSTGDAVQVGALEGGVECSPSSEQQTEFGFRDKDSGNVLRESHTLLVDSLQGLHAGYFIPPPVQRFAGGEDSKEVADACSEGREIISLRVDGGVVMRSTKWETKNGVSCPEYDSLLTEVTQLAMGDIEDYIKRIHNDVDIPEEPDNDTSEVKLEDCSDLTDVLRSGRDLFNLGARAVLMPYGPEGDRDSDSETAQQPVVVSSGNGPRGGGVTPLGDMMEQPNREAMDSWLISHLNSQTASGFMDSILIPLALYGCMVFSIFTCILWRQRRRFPFSLSASWHWLRLLPEMLAGKLGGSVLAQNPIWWSDDDSAANGEDVKALVTSASEPNKVPTMPASNNQGGQHKRQSAVRKAQNSTSKVKKGSRQVEQKQAHQNVQNSTPMMTGLPPKRGAYTDKQVSRGPNPVPPKTTSVAHPPEKRSGDGPARKVMTECTKSVKIVQSQGESGGQKGSNWEVVTRQKSQDHPKPNAAKSEQEKPAGNADLTVVAANNCSKKEANSTKNNWKSIHQAARATSPRNKTDCWGAKEEVHTESLASGALTKVSKPGSGTGSTVPSERHSSPSGQHLQMKSYTSICSSPDLQTGDNGRSVDQAMAEPAGVIGHLIGRRNRYLEKVRDGMVGAARNVELSSLGSTLSSDSSIATYSEGSADRLPSLQVASSAGGDTLSAHCVPIPPMTSLTKASWNPSSSCAQHSEEMETGQLLELGSSGLYNPAGFPHPSIIPVSFGNPCLTQGRMNSLGETDQGGVLPVHHSAPADYGWYSQKRSLWTSDALTSAGFSGMMNLTQPTKPGGLRADDEVSSEGSLSMERSKFLDTYLKNMPDQLISETENADS